MDTLIKECWRIFNKFKTEDFIVKPSIPILFFGDTEKYFRSKVKVVTVGLNPSKSEFPEDERFLRFPKVKEIYLDLFHGKNYDKYLSALNNYFRIKPYKKWFDSFEAILNGLNCSYYGKQGNTALHTDLCSPLATDPTWSKLPKKHQAKLELEGTRLWHSLIKFLSPDVIIISVAEKHLGKIEFPKLEKWSSIYTVQRRNPYEIKMSKIKIKEDYISIIIFGRAANTPFGLISTKDKKKIGLFLWRYFYGERR
jgi:hypothetical protein